MSWVAVAVAAVAVGTSVYSSDQQRKAMHQQQDALKAAQEKDAHEKAKAEVDAKLTANTALAATRRRRRDNALALGDPGGGSSVLGGVGSALGAGTATTTVATKPAGTALSAGGG